MTTRRKTLLALVMVPLALLLTLGSVSIASAHPASHLATHQVAKKKPTITISSFMFTVPAKVRAGATVKIVNKDAVRAYGHRRCRSLRRRRSRQHDGQVQGAGHPGHVRLPLQHPPHDEGHAGREVADPPARISRLAASRSAG